MHTYSRFKAGQLSTAKEINMGDTVVFTVMENENGTYRIFCKNGFNRLNRYDVKDLFKAMNELTNIFNNDIKMGILFEVED